MQQQPTTNRNTSTVAIDEDLHDRLTRFIAEQNSKRPRGEPPVRIRAYVEAAIIAQLNARLDAR